MGLACWQMRRQSNKEGAGGANSRLWTSNSGTMTGNGSSCFRQICTLSPTLKGQRRRGAAVTHIAHETCSISETGCKLWCNPEHRCRLVGLAEYSIYFGVDLTYVSVHYLVAGRSPSRHAATVVDAQCPWCAIAASTYYGAMCICR